MAADVIVFIVVAVVIDVGLLVVVAAAVYPVIHLAIVMLLLY